MIRSLIKLYATNKWLERESQFAFSDEATTAAAAASQLYNDVEIANNSQSRYEYQQKFPLSRFVLFLLVVHRFQGQHRRARPRFQL